MPDRYSSETDEDAMTHFPYDGRSLPSVKRANAETWISRGSVISS
jgi:hypothetical protein